MAHEGARSSKITYLGTKEKLVSVGFTKQSQRQFKVWDPRNLSKEIKKMEIDQAAGASVCCFGLNFGCGLLSPCLLLMLCR